MPKAKKLKSGNWNVRVTVHGKQYSFTDPDRRTALRMAAAFADEVREAIDNPPLIDAIQKYIDDREDTLSPATLRGYRSIERTMRNKYPSLCQKRLVAVTDKDIQGILTRMSKKTAKNYLGLIQPATGRKFNVTLPAGKQKEMRVPTDLEVLGLLEIFRGTEVEIPVMLGAFGGLRRGEICALTLQDFDGDYVIVSKDIVKDEFGSFVVKPPKTETSNRFVLLPHGIVELIRAKGYVTKLDPHQLSNAFQKKQIVLGVDPPYCFHSLRHYNASYLHAKGIPDAYIMARGGWATPAVMQKVYRHALQDQIAEMEKRSVEALQFPLQFYPPCMAE